MLNNIFDASANLMLSKEEDLPVQILRHHIHCQHQNQICQSRIQSIN